VSTVRNKLGFHEVSWNFLINWRTVQLSKKNSAHLSYAWLYLSMLRTHSIVSVLMSAGLEWAERVARMAKTRNAYRIVARMLKRENCNEDRRSMVWWWEAELAQNRVWLWALVFGFFYRRIDGLWTIVVRIIKSRMSWTCHSGGRVKENGEVVRRLGAKKGDEWNCK